MKAPGSREEKTRTRLGSAGELARDFGGVFSLTRVLKPGDLPPPDDRIVDLALLDMHHDYPNLGHDSIVRAVGEIARDLCPLLELAGMTLRIISYDVRRRHMIPEKPGKRHLIYLGTGGPGHVDPHLNDGVSDFAQGIKEDPGWERPLFGVFDAVLRNEEAVLLAVCHTFGVMCRWSGIARPVLRSPAKGGKSSGVVENVLTREACTHPWFMKFAEQLPDGRHFRVMDSRLFDLMPKAGRFPDGILPIAFEADAESGAEGEAITMVEFARDGGGVIPRILAVNHHPEIRDRRRQLELLADKLARGEVTAAWYNERASTLKDVILNRATEHSVMQTSQYSLIAPLRFHLYRLVRRRAAVLGCGSDLHENQVLRFPSGTLDREEAVHF